MKRWLPFGTGLLFVGLVILSADMRWFLPLFARINAIPFGDKVGHLVLIGSLAFLLNFSLRYKRVLAGPVRLHWGGVLIGFLITIEEFAQIWIPSRTFSLGDLAANYAGIACAELLARWCTRAWPGPPVDSGL